jgi:hypothetical protein
MMKNGPATKNGLTTKNKFPFNLFHKKSHHKIETISCLNDRNHEWVECDGLTDDWGGMVKCEVCAKCWNIRQMNHHGKWKIYGILSDSSNWKDCIMKEYNKIKNTKLLI